MCYLFLARHPIPTTSAMNVMPELTAMPGNGYMCVYMPMYTLAYNIYIIKQIYLQTSDIKHS